MKLGRCLKEDVYTYLSSPTYLHLPTYTYLPTPTCLYPLINTYLSISTSDVLCEIVDLILLLHMLCCDVILFYHMI